MSERLLVKQIGRPSRKFIVSNPKKIAKWKAIGKSTNIDMYTECHTIVKVMKE
jgi:hypothetical protein